MKNLRHENFSFFKNWLKYVGSIILGQKNHFDNKKVILASLNTNSRGKHQNRLNRSLMKRRIL